MSFKLFLLPPQNDTSRSWAARLWEALPEFEVMVAEDVI